jgi:transcription elongation GreA/GreB family factor
MLKRWLEYSASGMLESGERTEREPDSDFEMFVMHQIQSMGCEAVPQVGVAGYFVDIGVLHADWQYGFVLGVECDGVSYHSAKSARDRDRLRQEVLEHLGWKLHRIWSTDWFNNPRREADRLREVIAVRLQELKKREFEYATTAAPRQPEKVEPAEVREAVIALPLVSQQKPSALSARNQSEKAVYGVRVAVGDTVRVKYLTDDRKTLHITISRAKSDPSQGIVHCETPVAQALLGAEEGDEVEVLVGSYVRSAIVERIIKAVGV